jgi:hypothetical protein
VGNDRPRQPTEALCSDVSRNFAPRYAVLKRVGNRHSRIEVCTGDATERENQSNEDCTCRHCIGKKGESDVTPSEALGHDPGPDDGGNQESCS